MHTPRLIDAMTATTAYISSAEIAWARAAREAHPEMTGYGFRPGPGPDPWADGLTLEHLEEIAIARRWLEAMPWRSTVDSCCIGSYAAKHRAEAWARRHGVPVPYLREGALLLAAVALGVPVRPYGDREWGGFIGLTRRGLRATARR